MAKEPKMTMQDLRYFQALPLDVKVSMTKTRIREWVNYFGVDGVYVSFSGGKDSTVLLDLVRQEYPDAVAVYVDTGLEYPEIREFVKTFSNVVWLKPEKTFKQVISEYGYPFISKEVSQTIYELLDARNKGKDITKYAQYKRLIGEYKVDGKKAFSRERYQFLLREDAPPVSSLCCKVMKKNPTTNYNRETGRLPIMGTLATESRLRTSNWLINGCNGFDMQKPRSLPMSFWTEQDVLQYIKQNNLPICSVYGEIVEDVSQDGQLTLFDSEGSTKNIPKLKTTGCERTGCMFCGYGSHCRNDERFVRMKETHPKTYDYIMRPIEQGGLNYKEVIDWLNENGNLKIKY